MNPKKTIDLNESNARLPMIFRRKNGLWHTYNNPPIYESDYSDDDRLVIDESVDDDNNNKNDATENLMGPSNSSTEDQRTINKNRKRAYNDNQSEKYDAEADSGWLVEETMTSLMQLEQGTLITVERPLLMFCEKRPEETKGVEDLEEVEKTLSILCIRLGIPAKYLTPRDETLIYEIVPNGMSVRLGNIKVKVLDMRIMPMDTDEITKILQTAWGRLIFEINEIKQGNTKCYKNVSQL